MWRISSKQSANLPHVLLVLCVSKNRVTSRPLTIFATKKCSKRTTVQENQGNHYRATRTLTKESKKMVLRNASKSLRISVKVFHCQSELFWIKFVYRCKVRYLFVMKQFNSQYRQTNLFPFHRPLSYFLRPSSIFLEFVIQSVPVYFLHRCFIRCFIKFHLYWFFYSTIYFTMCFQNSLTTLKALLNLTLI
jgi:hypothetical protein